MKVSLIKITINCKFKINHIGLYYKIGHNVLKNAIKEFNFYKENVLL